MSINGYGRKRVKKMEWRRFDGYRIRGSSDNRMLKTRKKVTILSSLIFYQKCSREV